MDSGGIEAITVITYVVITALAYGIGMFPTAQLVSRTTGIDPTAAGSGNPGASNTFRVAGSRAGAQVLMGDVLKGFLASGIGLIFGGRALGVLCMLAVVLGHSLPVTRGFKGGKGVASGAGSALALWPVILVIATLIWALATKLTGKASIGSLTVVVVLPVGIALSSFETWEIFAAAGICAFIGARHWDNIRRLLGGAESDIRRSDG